MINTILRGAALATALLLPLSAEAQQAQKLRFASFIPDGLATSAIFKPFIEAANKDSQGTLDIEFFGNGALGRNPLQQHQMVLDGVADFAWVILPQTRGRFRETEVLELPGLFQDATDASTVSTRMLVKNKLQGFEDFYPVALVGTGPMSIHSRGQITSLDDMKGKKIRTAGQIESDTIKALGGVPIALTVNEIVEAIGRGSIDGVTSLPTVIFDFGFVSVTSAHYFTRLDNLPMAILMNRQKFDGLPKAGQDAIRKNSGEWIGTRYTAAVGPYEEGLIKKLKDDPKRKVVFPSDAELAKTKAMVRPVIDEWVKQSPRHLELYKAVETEIAELRAKR